MTPIIKICHLREKNANSTTPGYRIGFWALSACSSHAGGTMKINELIKKLREGNPDNDVVITSEKHEYTTDIGVSWDDRGIAVIYEMAGSKAY